MITPNTDPHANQLLKYAGAPAARANAVLILIHGRGSGAQEILSLADDFAFPGLAAIAPQAAANTWYPHSFLAPMSGNQPYLDSALNRIDSLVIELLTKGFSSEKIALLGFSQGACLIAEFVARHPRAYGAVMGLCGGLIGPPGTPRDYAGSLTDTPIFLGCGDPDPHIPFQRVRETESVFTAMGAKVQVNRYPGMPHSINEDELQICREMIRKVTLSM